MLKEMNQKLEKAMPLITPVSVLIGVLLSIWLKSFADVVPPTFIPSFALILLETNGILGKVKSCTTDQDIKAPNQ